MEAQTRSFRETASRELKNEMSQIFLSLLPPGFTILRQIGMSSFPDPDAAVEYARAIRAEVIERMPELLEEFEKNALSHGAKVLWARDAHEANETILDIARKRGITYVTKGKSMITEEIGLNKHLMDNCVEVFETDLGEVITQMLGLPPFHIVGPAINVPPEEISAVFLKKSIIKTHTTSPIELGKAVRAYLREKFRNLEMGIVGVNMAVAATGTIINVENEGNIRLTKSSPRTLVAVMSLEKVVPTMADALHMVRILCRNCTGQKMSSYVSMDTGPKKAAELDGPEELFIIIVDNGRSKIYHDRKTREVLRCIRCGGCLNTCPVYAKIGGYPYGSTYSGPMGQVMNPLLLGIEETADLYRACTLCGACAQVCPAGVDHPSLLLTYRAWEISRKARDGAGLHRRIENSFATLASLGMGLPWLWHFGSRIMRPFLKSLSRDGYIRNIPFGLQGWFSCRDLPAMPEKTFHEMWDDLESTRDTFSRGRGKEAP
jgi:L-lactate dehydrogenase complex protein LldF